MAKINFNKNIIQSLLEFNKNQIWIDLDKSADVMYISFKRPQNANDSIMEDNDIIYNYDNEELVGITIMNANKKYRLNK